MGPNLADFGSRCGVAVAAAGAEGEGEAEAESPRFMRRIAEAVALTATAVRSAKNGATASPFRFRSRRPTPLSLTS